MITTIIFDLDGTLVGTTEAYRQKLLGMVLRSVETSATREEINSFWFEADRDKIIQDCFKVSPQLFWYAYRMYDSAYADERLANMQPYDDVPVIPELRSQGYKLGILTGAPPDILERELTMLGKENFGAVICANNSTVIPIKPHPKGLELCLEQLGSQKQESVYIGNASEDIQTARNAGVKDILIDRREYKFQGLNPSVTIYSLHELENILHNLNL